MNAVLEKKLTTLPYKNTDVYNITYNLEGNPFKKTKEDILINKTGKINNEKIELTGAVITGGQTHYYKLNVKCTNCKSKILGDVKLESD